MFGIIVRLSDDAEAVRKRGYSTVSRSVRALSQLKEWSILHEPTSAIKFLLVCLETELNRSIGV